LRLRRAASGLTRRLYMRFLVLAVALTSGAALAQDIPKPVIESLARDLAELQKVVVDAQRQQAQSTSLANILGVLEVTRPAEVKAGATEDAPTMVKVEAGKTYPVVAERPGWYAVQLDRPYRGSTTGWLSAGVVDLAYVKTSATAGEEIFTKLTESAARIKQNYQANPYVSVTGFQVNLVPPSITVNFEFKK
jgi:hypothetical protein